MSASDKGEGGDVGMMWFSDYSGDGSNISHFILPASDPIAIAFAVHSTLSSYIDMDFRKYQCGFFFVFLCCVLSAISNVPVELSLTH